MPFRSVKAFQEDVLGIVTTEKRLLSEKELELANNQMCEEVTEFIEAHETQDFIGAIDAMIDLMYFAIGNLHKMGLTPDEIHKCFMVVNHCNMTKTKGVVARRGDGSVPDAIKPDGWIGPEVMITKVLAGEI